VKCLQDLATLRFKQNRQHECRELLEEVAARGPPHPATQENLGTVYNSLGDHVAALRCFQHAVKLKGGVPDKEDLWNIGIARKGLGELDVAVETLEGALRRFVAEAPECPVTVAKVHDSLAEAYLSAGQAVDAARHYALAVDLYTGAVGAQSPLYGGGGWPLAGLAGHRTS